MRIQGWVIERGNFPRGLKWTANTLSSYCVNLWGPEEHFFLLQSRKISAILAKEIHFQFH